jgi:methanogenic corrinoid protein MtbC1
MICKLGTCGMQQKINGLRADQDLIFSHIKKLQNIYNYVQAAVYVEDDKNRYSTLAESEIKINPYEHLLRYLLAEMEKIGELKIIEPRCFDDLM